MWNGSGFDVNQNWAKRPSLWEPSRWGEGAYAIRQWAHGPSGRLWIAWATPSHDRSCRPGASVNTSYKAPPVVWVGCWVALKRFPTFRAGHLGNRCSACWPAGVRGGGVIFRESPVANDPFGLCRESCPAPAYRPTPPGVLSPVSLPNRYSGHGTAVGTPVVVPGGPAGGKAQATGRQRP
jgi:hypothetical protein